MIYQIIGVDYFDSFSPLTKFVTVRLFLAIVTGKSWHIHQLNINKTFLYGYLNEEIYVYPLEGYTKANED